MTDFQAWASDPERKSGDRFVYHTGNLAEAADRDWSVAHVRRIAWALHEGGAVHLTQQRVTDTQCNYIATFARKPGARQ